MSLLGGLERRFPNAATGALTFGKLEQHPNVVLMEDGRVCWAAAADMRRRFTDLILRESAVPLDRAKLETLFQECRQKGRPLGETLVRRGYLTEQGLSRTLRQHNAESLAQIALDGYSVEEASWHDRHGKKYDARFTYSPTELLVHVGELRVGEPASTAQTSLEGALAGTSAVGLACSLDVDPECPFPVGALGANALTIEELMKIARFTKDGLGRVKAFAPNPVLCSMWRGGWSALTWQRAGLVFTALCEDAPSLAKVMGRVQRERAS